MTAARLASASARAVPSLTPMVKLKVLPLPGSLDSETSPP